MKKHIFVLLSILLLNLNCKAQHSEKRPAAVQSENAGKPENTPESVTAYFFRSQINKDERWKEVLPPQNHWNERLRGKIEKYQRWTVKKFRIIKTHYAGDRKAEVEIYMEVEFKGRTASGQDTVELEKINGRWVIVSVPT